MAERKGKAGDYIPEFVHEKPALSKDGRPIVYITTGDNARRIDCPLLGIGLGANMSRAELKHSFIGLASDYAYVVITRYIRQGETLPNEVIKACRKIYNTRVLNDLEKYFVFKNSH